MKVPLLSSLVLWMGLSSPLFSIERPKSLDQEHAVNEGDIPRAVVEQEELVQDGHHVSTSWLGVFGEAPDETLRHHLGLESGGIVLRYVAEESPAAVAGLNAHDIVLQFADRKIDSQASLRDAVLQYEPGETVTLEVVSKGVQGQREVTLGERPADLIPERPRKGGNLHGGLKLEDFPALRNRFRELERLFPQDGDGPVFGGDIQGQMERMKKDMAEQLEQFERLPGVGLDLERLLKDLPRHQDGFNMSLKSSSSVTLVDEEGQVEMKVNEGSKEVTVRDMEGEIVYEGPWDTEQDRAAVPPAIRERVEKLNFDENGNGIRLHFKKGLEDLEDELLDIPE